MFTICRSRSSHFLGWMVFVLNCDVHRVCLLSHFHHHTLSHGHTENFDDNPLHFSLCVSALQTILELCIPEKELAKICSQI
jgi:hypothetical protein